MRWVLPGGAVLDGRDARAVACQPFTAVRVGTASGRAAPQKEMASRSVVREEPVRTAQDESRVDPESPVGKVTDTPRNDHGGRLATTKLILEVLTLLVGLIGAILALFGLSRK